jgi:muconolactone delta-isomerase
VQFLSISRRKPGVTDEACAPWIAAEAERARELYAQGSLRQIWHRADMPGACLLWEAESVERVNELLSTLPFAKAGLLDIEVIPLTPYRGFAPTRRSG